METDSAQEQDAGSSSQASGTDLSEVTRGAWMGSSVSQYEIDWLYRSRRIPEGVTCRIPGDEIEPVLEPGERVVFLAHFERGFGLPVSSFFRDFLDFYKLQPHHLPGNAIFYLSCYVTFMEAYIGIRPTRETFARFFALRINSVQGLDIPKPKPPVQCGSCIIGSRQASPFFKFSGLESCRSWQGTFFYVRNNGAADLIDLPPFDPAPPTKTNWSYNPKESHNETNRIIRFMKQRMKDTNLCSDDIIRTFISRRVLPLKRRAHKMCEMYGPGDPTKITGLPLSKKDVVLKARQICQTSMPENWEWGLRPLSSTNPPTQEAKDRFPGIESDKRGRCRKRGLDKFDPDPVIFWKDLKMGRTPAARLGKAPPEPSDVPSANLNPQVHEHVAPLQAEAGKEFVDKLMAQGQKNKTPASDAGSSQAPPAKRFRTEPVAGKVVAMRRHKGKQMPTATGPALKLGPRPEGSAGSARTSTPPPHSSPAPSGAGNTSASPLGGTTSSGRAAPTPPDPRAEEDFASPPETQDTGASNMGAGKEPAGRAEPSVPPVLEKKKRKKTSSKTAPEASAPETSAPPPPPETSAPEATGPTPTPPPTQGAPATAPKPPPASLKITDYLKPGASRGKATDGSASSGSQPLVLHTGPAAMVVQDKPSGLLGRIVELKRGGQDLGPLLPYAQRWNAADISAATRGLGKDRLPAPDPAGPRSTEEHFSRLKRAVKEFDSAWYDATANVVVSSINFSWLFPDSQAHAIKKVAEHRAQQAGNNLGAPWDPYDHLVALSARISHMRSVDRNLSDIPEVASQLFKTLWPGEAVPETFSLISDRLKGACRRIREWQCSAARAGADSALRIACSWYPELDLDAFIGVREGAPTDVDPVLTAKRQDRAYHIAEYADMRTFIPPPEDVKDYLSEEEEDEGEDVPPPTPDAGAAPPEAPAA
ncbi:hypothetical protein QYE76_044221 [Lolium multiflorum]|uniref:Transposase (putative) gypsy type domain-containing protein n=1 Tax=Lolium multiflorum TaxID=4521 RepID=A0AAD8WYX0_LOLMU|nr:hypothetical protein QYE76_044221 [Lolium multiflorum]